MNITDTAKLPKKSHKIIIIEMIILVIIIFGWAGLTKAGYIENFFNISFLQPKYDISGRVEYFKFQRDEDTVEYGEDTFGKPVIYLYPEKVQNVNVKLKLMGYLTTSYPNYNNGWSVTAHPDGKILNNLDNKEYSYLFWEGIDRGVKYDLSSGFVVKGSDSVEFLQSKLADIGLSPKEYNEFIVYWLPKLEKNNYNLLHFATEKEYDNRAILEIDPSPESLLRVFMVFKEVDKKTYVKPQSFKPFIRKGFTVVEWGGAILD